jgi:E3 ubiquitin-protein ligase DMA1/2
MWPQFICPNCRAVADLEADVDDPFPDAEWEEVDADDAAEEQAHSAQATNITSMLQVPSIEKSNSTNCAGSVIGCGDSQENTGEDTTGSESELQQAMNHLNITPHDTLTTGPPESHSSIGPVNIRSGRPTARQGNTSDGRTITSDIESSMRIDRTPSPSGRLPVGVSDILSGPDGPMTPRNDAGPFIFDGSAGRAAGARMSALSLTAATETPPTES